MSPWQIMHQIDPDDVRRLHAQGLSDYAIAERLGRTGPGIRRVRQKLGLPANFTSGGRAVNNAIEPSR